MYDKLLQAINEAGIWDGSRKHSHAFLLSPSVYSITKAQQLELTQLGYALADCMRGLSHIAVICYDTQRNYKDAWLTMRRVFSSGVPKVYQELQGSNVADIPKLLKVDLMVDHEGNFRIAEIDGHNKHGLGYSTLGKRMRAALYPDARSLPGAVQAVAQGAKQMGHTQIKLLYADQERFYIPEFEIAAQEFAKHGIQCSVVSELEADQSFLQDGLFLDLPFLNHRTDYYETIICGYKQGRIRFIIPPKPFLGAKGVLAILRNDGHDELIEAVLRSFIPGKSLQLVRKYIPETILVGKSGLGKEAILDRTMSKRYVLKESISSGMKGTVFSDDPSFAAVLDKAAATNVNWILQEEVTNQPQIFSWFEMKATSGLQEQTSDDWFMRVTAQYVNHQLADIIVTARRDKSVHGAKDCIQLGTIVV